MSNKVELMKFSDHTRVYFLCPGCGEGHGLPVEGEPQSANWGWNRSLESPTLTPSILSRGTVPITDEEHARIMRGEKVEPRPLVCHSFVTDGCIQFLGDSTHELRGMTVDLAECGEVTP